MSHLNRREFLAAGAVGALALGGGNAFGAEKPAFRMGAQSYSFRTFKLPDALAKANELELKYLEGTDQFMPRVTLGLDIPGLGRARGDVEVAHLPSDTRRGVVGSAGLEIGFGGLSAGGGALFGSGDSSDC